MTRINSENYQNIISRLEHKGFTKEEVQDYIKSVKEYAGMKINFEQALIDLTMSRKKHLEKKSVGHKLTISVNEKGNFVKE